MESNDFSRSRWCLLGVLSLLLSMIFSASATAILRSECSSPPLGTVFCEDFEGTNPKAHFDDYDGNTDAENQVITDGGPSGDPSNKVIRLRVPSGQAGTSDLIKVLPGSYDKLYARWYFKYEQGFNFNARNHGSGLAAGNRNLIGQSGIRPTGSDWAGFFMQYQEGTAKPYAYSYYRGMYQDCTNPNGGCWGDALPCVYDNGSYYCTKPEHRPSASMTSIVAGQWYCIEQLLDLGTPSTTGQSPNGRLALWLNSQLLGDYQNLWIRTASSLKIQNFWLNLYHHDGTHSTAGELIDNIIIATQPIGCGVTIVRPSPPVLLQTP